MSFTRLSTASFFSMSSAKLENYSVQAKKLREMAFKSKKRVPPWHEALEAAARASEGNPLITLLVPKWCMSNSLNGPFTTIFQMSILLHSPLACAEQESGATTQRSNFTRQKSTHNSKKMNISALSWFLNFSTQITAIHSTMWPYYNVLTFKHVRLVTSSMTKFSKCKISSLKVHSAILTICKSLW